MVVKDRVSTLSESPSTNVSWKEVKFQQLSLSLPFILSLMYDFYDTYSFFLILRWDSD